MTTHGHIGMSSDQFKTLEEVVKLILSVNIARKDLFSVNTMKKNLITLLMQKYY